MNDATFCRSEANYKYDTEQGQHKVQKQSANMECKAEEVAANEK